MIYESSTCFKILSARPIRARARSLSFMVADCVCYCKSNIPPSQADRGLSYRWDGEVPAKMEIQLNRNAPTLDPKPEGPCRYHESWSVYGLCYCIAGKLNLLSWSSQGNESPSKRRRDDGYQVECDQTGGDCLPACMVSPLISSPTQQQQPPAVG